MSSFLDRFTVALKRAGGPTAVSALTQMPRTAIYRHRDGGTYPSLPQILLYCNAFKVTPNWLLLGAEEPSSAALHAEYRDAFEKIREAASDFAVALRSHRTIMSAMLLNPDQRAITNISLETLAESVEALAEAIRAGRAA